MFVIWRQVEKKMLRRKNHLQYPVVKGANGVGGTICVVITKCGISQFLEENIAHRAIAIFAFLDKIDGIEH